ncbi:M15 family metallopeptidase [Lacihabitans soyangensis]|nr:M15 family metallopeptidase [Lacihabitans soyangensis]
MSINFEKPLLKALKIVLSFLLTVSCTENTNSGSEKHQDKDSTEIVISLEMSDYESSMQNQGLVNIQKLDSSLVVDLKYSSTDNFFGEDVYGILKNAYLQEKPARALKAANEALMATHPNLRLIIYDAARPIEIQKVLWNKLDSLPPKKRKDFVADPLEGSIHNFGCAVDLSIYNSETKEALDMGTKYDYFGHLAYPRLENQMLQQGNLTEKQLENRQLLRKVMQSAGFEPITSEWWHFNYYSRKKAKELYKIIE